jgi:recombination protein RecT
MSTTALSTNPIQSVAQMLERNKQAIAARLPRHVAPDRIIKVALTAITKTPKLMECTRQSLILAILQAAELGLEPGGSLGEGWLIPYKDTCQFIPGYRGLISLARRSGQIISIEAHVVHEADAFHFALGLEPVLNHVPDLEEEDSGKITHAYAIARLVGGGVQFEVMSKNQIDKIRARSRAANNGPWVTDYEEMARKTTIRRLAKYLPLSVELARALDLQAATESGDFAGTEIDAGGIVEAGNILEAPTRTQQVGAQVAAKVAAMLAPAHEQPMPPAEDESQEPMEPMPTDHYGMSGVFDDKPKGRRK